MKENFPNSVKEIDMHVREAQRVPKEIDGCEEAHSKTHHN